MIFLGDVAIPSKEHALKFHNLLEGCFNLDDQNLILNLEGIVSADNSPLRSDVPLVFNHPDTLENYKRKDKLKVLLANNHTLDLSKSFRQTLDLLTKHQVQFTGAHTEANLAGSPLVFHEDGFKIRVYNFCWDFLLYHQNNPDNGVHVSVIEEKRILTDIAHVTRQFPEDRIVIYFHWSFDLEHLPFPAMRQFSKALIDLGVNLVVGCHSHCIQGGEQYKDGYIVYGLGNFYFPTSVYANGSLKFPGWASQGMALSWSASSNVATLDFFRFEGAGQEFNVTHVKNTPFDDKHLGSFSPYQTMSKEEYLAYFKKHRRKKLLIPVFKEYEDHRTNRLKVSFLKIRAKTARFLARKKLISWQQ